MLRINQERVNAKPALFRLGFLFGLAVCCLAACFGAMTMWGTTPFMKYGFSTSVRQTSSTTTMTEDKDSIVAEFVKFERAIGNERRIRNLAPKSTKSPSTKAPKAKGGSKSKAKGSSKSKGKGSKAKGEGGTPAPSSGDLSMFYSMSHSLSLV